jgi:hypothetical protein
VLQTNSRANGRQNEQRPIVGDAVGHTKGSKWMGKERATQEI